MTQSAALGTSHEVRLRRAEAWAAGRKKKQAEGGSKGRNRGKGAQLRRQVRKRQETMDVWRRQQVEAERVAAKGDTELLGELKVEQKRHRRLVTEAEAKAEEAIRRMGFMKTALERQD